MGSAENTGASSLRKPEYTVLPSVKKAGIPVTSEFNMTISSDCCFISIETSVLIISDAVKTPDAEYRCSGLTSVDLVPSPKSQ